MKTRSSGFAVRGLLHKIFRVSKPGLPLKAYQELNAFKLYMLDTGLLAAHAGLATKTSLQGNVLFEEFKGALTRAPVPTVFWRATVAIIGNISATSCF